MRGYKQYVGKVENCDCSLGYDCGFLKIGDEYSDALIYNLLKEFTGKNVKITVEVVDES